MVIISKKIQAAVVGVGFIGKQHIEAIHRIPNTQVVALVEPNGESAKRAAESYGIDHYFTSIDDMLNMDGIDVVHICTPNFLHYPMAKQCVEAGLNVFCEKPLSLTTLESNELKELARKHSVYTAVNLNYRSNVMIREMKHRISSGMIGTPLLGQAQYIQDWLMFDTDYDWHFDPSKVGPSRSVADIGTHLFDLIQFVYGEKIVKVFADLMIVYPTRKKREQTGETFALEYGDTVTEVDVVNEDAAFILVQLESGIKVSMDISQVTGGYKNGVELVVSGSKHSLSWHQERADRLIIGNRASGNEELYADPKYIDPSLRRFISLPNGHAVGWADAFKNSISEFYEDIRNDGHNDSQSYVDFETGHTLMKLVEASLQSSKEKRWIDME
ncbi:Gfo/Idh/MocA family protein [Erysipelothrix larvae]|uniref:Gfo/Idh/MocA family protein n=1 Tax=Erysipelothrix larvae TaxID=1514105 RepID=UPI00098FFEA4|nr:Gfo/Idh/MocA family oxidoreductase [Erysipelothrix larvae]